LNLTAAVTGLCKFFSAPTTLPFGTIDPSLSANIVISVPITYKCTRGTPSAGVTVTGGLTGHTLKNTVSATDTIAYTLAISGDTQTGTGFGTGTQLTLNVQGTITALQFQNALVGSYTDSVTLNIAP
jgi:hypothetical protein